MTVKETQQATSDLLVNFLGLNKSQADHKPKEEGNNNEIQTISNK